MAEMTDGLETKASAKLSFLFEEVVDNHEAFLKKKNFEFKKRPKANYGRLQEIIRSGKHGKRNQKT
ncbi:hypothetical protein [Saccharibacillus endophyticus]|uniref:hypothetical protein n=1 Tax=Saccharibacillus endophyticus TaxID=2060666 RepID=UPI001557F7DB|nr:hypothetical protein [Saccharibacillus endophyticus]